MFGSSAAAAIAYRVSDGGVQWKSQKIAGLGNEGGSDRVAIAGDTLCFSGSACGVETCAAEITCPEIKCVLLIVVRRPRHSILLTLPIMVVGVHGMGAAEVTGDSGWG